MTASGVKIGKDSLGRRFKTVDGKRVNVSTGSQIKKLDPIGKMFALYTKRATNNGQVKSAVGKLINQRFRTMFNTVGKTAVGRKGRAMAAKMILDLLNKYGEKIEPEEVDLDPGTFSGPKFIKVLQSHGVEIEPPPSPNDDYEILKVVHAAGLDANSLKMLIRNRSNP